MEQFLIEKGILKAYFGVGPVVVVPDGVKQIGGCYPEFEPKEPAFPRELCGDPIGYKAFYCNNSVEEIYLPDSVETIGFKSMEHCKNLRILSFSSKMKTVECNGLLGCNNLKTIIYRGTVFEFTCLSLAGHLDLDVVYCTDGTINLHQEFYIEELHFPGTRAEWDRKYSAGDWRNKRCRKIVCIDDD